MTGTLTRGYSIQKADCAKLDRSGGQLRAPSA